MPAAHIVPGAQVFVQMPLLRSVETSTQVLPQRICVPPQLQTLLAQVPVGPHEFPHAPQLAGSVVVSVQTPLQTALGALQAAPPLPPIPPPVALVPPIPPPVVVVLPPIPPPDVVALPPIPPPDVVPLLADDVDELIVAAVLPVADEAPPLPTVAPGKPVALEVSLPPQPAPSMPGPSAPPKRPPQQSNRLLIIDLRECGRGALRKFIKGFIGSSDTPFAAGEIDFDPIRINAAHAHSNEIEGANGNRSMVAAFTTLGIAYPGPRSWLIVVAS